MQSSARSWSVRLGAVPLLCYALVGLSPQTLLAQGQSAQKGLEDYGGLEDPSAVAGAFYDALAGHKWDEVAATVHPETLDLFRYRIGSMLGADAEGSLERLVFGTTPRPFGERSDDAIFAALLRAIEANTPALIAVLATNSYDALGHLLEGLGIAHVLLRVTPFTNGSAPTRTAVVTLKRTEAGWKIVESGELDALATALTGLSLTAKASPGGTGS